MGNVDRDEDFDKEPNALSDRIMWFALNALVGLVLIGFFVFMAYITL